MPDKNRSTKNVGKLIAKLESMPKIALTVIDTIKTPRRPKESPKPPIDIRQSSFQGKLWRRALLCRWKLIEDRTRLMAIGMKHTFKH